MKLRITSTDFGFTLIEIIITMAILALLTTAAVMTFAAPLRSARMRDAIDQLRAADADARTAARNFGQPVTLALNLTYGTIERIAGGNVVSRIAIGGGVTLHRIRIGASESSFDSATIAISPMGLSESYAIELAGSGENESQWLLFAGLTGQMTKLNDESQLQNTLVSR